MLAPTFVCASKVGLGANKRRNPCLTIANILRTHPLLNLTPERSSNAPESVGYHAGVIPPSLDSRTAAYQLVHFYSIEAGLLPIVHW